MTRLAVALALIGSLVPITLRAQAPVGVRAFDAASIARAIEAELGAPGQGNAQAPAQTSARKKRDSIWNGVLIGAGVGGAVGAIVAATGDDCMGYVDPGGAEVCVMRTDPDVGLNLAFGALVGAGVGAIIDWLIK